VGRLKSRLGERFAAIPLEVLQSAAYRSLRHSARSTLLALAAQFRGQNNGSQALPRDVCRRFGLDYHQAHRDVRVLEERGLVKRTYDRRYWSSKSRTPVQWGLAWRPITHSGNEPLDRPVPAPNEWVKWADEEKSLERRAQPTGAQSATQTDPTGARSATG
jgi:hypothetical protein